MKNLGELFVVNDSSSPLETDSIKTANMNFSKYSSTVVHPFKRPALVDFENI